jgi:hypothetical protein
MRDYSPSQEYAAACGVKRKLRQRGSSRVKIPPGGAVESFILHTMFARQVV